MLIMTTNHIIAKLAKDLKIPQGIIKEVISKTFSEIDAQISEERLVMIRGYIKFVCSKRKTKKRDDKLSIKDYLQLKTKDK
jgi:nucleoid DNA-binding protein|tara:strand:- start:242 stop:484 length:243 start_codon:yes stop_codon:yes gene_type:complete